MKRSSWIPWVVLVAASGCTTLLPAQTASTVEPGAYRLGGQLSLSPWCSPYPPFCDTLPTGAPVPELRVSGRHGLVRGVDVGLSVGASSVVSQFSPTVKTRGLQLGVIADGKAEVASVPGEGGRHLLAVGGGVGYETETAIGELQLSVPLWYGFQFHDGRELFVGPRYVQRITFQDVDADGRREALNIPSLGLSAGYASAGPVRFITALEYFASTTYPGNGVFNLSAGVLWDVGGRAGR